ncbi:MAG TPA: hypothetical protein VGC13_08615 [Longimicrobium sp.]|jgi:hypothetical protein
MKPTLNPEDLKVSSFETSAADKVAHEAVWPCTGCMSGCGIQPPA